MLHKLLKFLDSNIDLEHIEKTEQLHIKTLEFEDVPRLPVCVGAPVNYEGKPFSIEEIHGSLEKMMYNELLGCVNPHIVKG